MANNKKFKNLQSNLLIEKKSNNRKKISFNWQLSNKMLIIFSGRIKSALLYGILVLTIFYCICLIDEITATSDEILLSHNISKENIDNNTYQEIINNKDDHNYINGKIIKQVSSNKINNSGRQGRQYDINSSINNVGGVSSSSSNIPNNQETISTDGYSLFAGQQINPSLMANNNYATSATTNLASVANYANELLAGNNYQSYAPQQLQNPYLQNHYQQQHQLSADLLPLARNYHHQPNFHANQHAYPVSMIPPPPSPAQFGPPTGILNSPMFPLISKSFDLSEIVCTAIAVAIGAIIVGAPFILIYMFIMSYMNGGSFMNGLNQLNGNNNVNGGSSSGTISLTGPNTSQQNNGRKKRHTLTDHDEVNGKKNDGKRGTINLKELISNEELTRVFKLFSSSLSKYQI